MKLKIFSVIFIGMFLFGFHTLSSIEKPTNELTVTIPFVDSDNYDVFAIPVSGGEPDCVELGFIGAGSYAVGSIANGNYNIRVCSNPNTNTKACTTGVILTGSPVSVEIISFDSGSCGDEDAYCGACSL